MPVATAKKTNGKPDSKHNIDAVRQAYYDASPSTTWRRCGR